MRRNVQDSPPPSEVPRSERDPESSVEQEQEPADKPLFKEAEANAPEGEREKVTAANEIAEEGKPMSPSHGEGVEGVEGIPPQDPHNDEGAEEELPREPVVTGENPGRMA
jgi:hypothetical protein